MSESWDIEKFMSSTPPQGSSGFGEKLKNLPGMQKSSINLSAARNPLEDSIVPCENCGVGVTQFWTAKKPADAGPPPVEDRERHGWCEVDIKSPWDAELTKHSPERCQSFRREAQR